MDDYDLKIGSGTAKDAHYSFDWSYEDKKNNFYTIVSNPPLMGTQDFRALQQYKVTMMLNILKFTRVSDGVKNLKFYIFKI